ncbi:unnamed protein product [Aspergillus oryzae]|uniref:Glucose-6-phosphate 1-dehydrogenase n=2 Tax=Aspergillus oryzae TaxID=5062 RepID=A0AAN4YHL9_ASPOZ|nr:unnamed protein product [Aspergillus oryzae]GMG26940.1 unnamed protein product [Aspergillus oryzae]GMG49952.1 unnamed protein product [Aspergillus oryzae var. brunneus]
MDHEEYLRRVRSYIKTPTKEIEEQLDSFCQLCSYVSGQYDKDESFQNLTRHLEDIEKGHKEQNRVFYMALPPSVFTTVSEQLKRNCYPKNGVAHLQSSRDLQKALEPNWKEEEIFRIDHYLGKEMVKNILIMRFGNEFFNATWNRHHIDNVQVRVLRAMDAIEPKNVIIGQYGKSLDGSKPAYKEDETVPQDSRCPTFCALVAYIKNERWDGVPFIMKAGKGTTSPLHSLCCSHAYSPQPSMSRRPRSPNESVYIKMNSKLPGLSMQTVVTELDLTYRRRFSDLKIPEAYESLILDALKGDHSNFVRDDELDASWRIFTPLLHYLDDNKEIIPMEYPYGKLWICVAYGMGVSVTNGGLGSRGPAVLDDFTASFGYKFSDAAGYQWPLTSTPNRL